MQTGHFTIGILAHVDAGKTTLAEGFFYLAKKTRQLGRVDHRDSYFDYFAMERSRGITIYSKTAQLSLGEYEVTLLDTPGHVDFSAEAERSLGVMDYAILIISGTDGIQSHTLTLFELLKKYRVPVFVFINKMDREEADRDRLLNDLKKEFGESCVDFTGYTDALAGKEDTQDFLEELALCDENWMERWLSGEALTKNVLQTLIRDGMVIPCFFGSALKMEGVEEFYQALGDLTMAPDYPDTFGARIFKVSTDEKGMRLAHMKLTGGTLRARETVGEEQKVSQIRICEGNRYETVQEAKAGMIVAVAGLSDVQAGDVLGGEKRAVRLVSEPVLSYTVFPEDHTDAKVLYQKLSDFAKEEPELAISWEEKAQQIRIRLMGAVQTEVLKEQILERYGVPVSFGKGIVLYRETIGAPVVGIGHFEPLRHYAEVHVLIEPGERGSGIVFENRCPDELLERSWQNTAMRHLKETEHIGVLTGSALTDVRISLVAGRAHRKHSEGADFREACQRAVRQGLMMAENILLEPVYAFVLDIPSAQVGRAMTDIRNMGGSFSEPELTEDRAVLKGKAPVSAMQEYHLQVQSYTGGQGRLSCRLAGYEPCGNAKEVIEMTGYDPDADLDNPSSSLFCRQGAAVFVPWAEVPEAARTESGIVLETAADPENETDREPAAKSPAGHSGQAGGISAFSKEDRELQAIFERTYGGRDAGEKNRNAGKSPSADRMKGFMNSRERQAAQKAAAPKEQYLLVDGYNIIHAWEELKDLARENLDSARDALMDILSDYHGSREGHLILVFDAYRVRGGEEHVLRYHNIDVVYTREAETADAYIERVTKKIAKNHDVTVATSDALEQIIIWGHGARRMSASELKADVEQARIEVRAFLQQKNSKKTRLLDHLDEEDARRLEEMRLGKEE